MAPEQRLVVALSGRAEDAALIRYADRLMELNSEAGPLARPRPASTDSGPMESASVAVDEATGLLLTAPRGVSYLESSSSQALERLLARAADPGTAALIVGSGLERRSLRTLVRQAACSVWFVPDGASEEFQRILVPVDFSVRAADALRLATVLARLSGGAGCLAMHAYYNDQVLTYRPRDPVLLARLAEAYASFVAPIDTLGVPIAPLFREEANVPHSIRAAASEQKADLVVLASRGRTWASALLQESIAERTLEEIQVPLLVVKHFGAQVGLLRLLRERTFHGRIDLHCN